MKTSKHRSENLLTEKFATLSKKINITKYNNQQELLLVSSGGGFEKQRKVPPKKLVKDYGMLQLFKNMAHMANWVYCSKENDDVFGKDYIGPEVIKSQITKTMFTLEKLLIGDNSAVRVDSYWWRLLPYDFFKGFGNRIRDAINILRRGIEANKPIHIFLTGHGIGGCNVPKYNKNIYTTITTFGSPRPGNSQLAAEFQQRLKLGCRVYRITHANDYLPHFPKKSIDGKLYIHPGNEYWIPDRNCNCEDPDADRILLEGYDIIYECLGFSTKDTQKYGENPGCNLGTDSEGTRAHFGPYFGVTFGNCEEPYPIGAI
ncbi:hypothetical protein G9A89_009769 [Geosiphon pyriformis]|nr:hypothetical protein G9A89_009769 [Geosiphon pyriformis]